MTITHSKLVKVAKQEINEWKLPQGLALAIIFAFCHRLETGETVEQTFFKQPTSAIDYEI